MSKVKLYIASSWRNEEYPALVMEARDRGYDVHDWRNPPDGGTGFKWSEIDPNWQNWTAAEYRKALSHPVAFRGFNSDLNGMKWADVGILLLPSGRSAHLEIGWFTGAGKYTIVLTRDNQEPELMAKLCDRICCNHDELWAALNNYKLKFMKARA